MEEEKVTKLPNTSPDPKKKDHAFIEKIERFELKEKIRIKIELSKNGELIKSYENYNSQVMDFEMVGFPYIPADAKPKKGEGNFKSL